MIERERERERESGERNKVIEKQSDERETHFLCDVLLLVFVVL